MFFILQNFAMKYPNYKTPKKEGDQYQFSFKLKDSAEKTISKISKTHGLPVSAKKRNNSIPEVYPLKTNTQKDIFFSNEDDLICELLEPNRNTVPKNRAFTLEYFRQVHEEYIAKNGRQYMSTGYNYPFFSNEILVSHLCCMVPLRNISEC